MVSLAGKALVFEAWRSSATFLLPAANTPAMLAARTTLPHAEAVRRQLLKRKLLHPEYQLVKEFGQIYFPLARRARVANASVEEVRFSFPKKEKRLTAEEALAKILTPRELELLPRSQEMIGGILILEIPEQLRRKEKAIAEAFLRQHPSVHTVVRKDNIHSGEYRLRRVKILAGKITKETLHRENGVVMKLHLERTYFSSRLAQERLRIAKQVKPGEKVLVLFSGIAPYPLVLAKNSPAARIHAIELNPLAHRYAVENVRLNGFSDRIIVYQGDVRRILPKLSLQFDRIVMPLPKTGEQYLDCALQKAKKGTMIHLYAFLREEELRAERLKIRELCTRYRHPASILRTVTCGQYSPFVHRICLDMKLLK